MKNSDDPDRPAVLRRLERTIMMRYKNLHQFSRIAGLPYETLWKTFNAKHSIDWNFIRKILDGLQITEDEFLGGREQFHSSEEYEICNMMKQMKPELKKALLATATTFVAESIAS